VLAKNVEDFRSIDQVVEYGNATDFKTQAVVSKSLGDEEEKSAATADVQDFLRREGGEDSGPGRVVCFYKTRPHFFAPCPKKRATHSDPKPSRKA
jgi:hypothetical protein